MKFPWLSWPSDVFLATAACTLGGPVGYIAFLLVECGVNEQMPNRRDFKANLIAISAGTALIVGLFGAVVLRSCIGPIRRRRLWATWWLLAGAVTGPLMLILLFAWVMANRPY